MRGPLFPRADALALLLPLLLLLAAIPGSRTRPHVDPADVPAAQAGETPSRLSFYAPGAWRPVVDAATPGDAAAPRSNGAALHIDRVASRVRVEDMNRSGRVDVQPPAQASTASGTSTSPTERPTTLTTAADAAATATTAAAAAAAASTTPAAAAAGAAPHLGAAIHRVTSQLLTAAEDVRTPPKLRHSQENRGQGVAVPVILEEDELARAEEVLTRRSTAKPLEEGLSTWVLLSGSHDGPSTTPQPSSAAPAKPTRATPTSKRPPTTTAAAPKRSPPTTRKPTTAAPPTTTTTTTTTTARAKPAKKNASSSYDAALAPALTRKPPTAVHKPTTTTTTPTPTTTTAVTTTTAKSDAPEDDQTATLYSIITESPDAESSTAEDPEAKTETSTRRTRRPGSGGKKKKNKNKRRKNRPNSNSTALAESKIGEAESNSTKPGQSKDRPLSTRIYNYLAREVMPSFGVGLLGLAITAGLAGLIMYPFGGGAVKRTYEVDAPSVPQGNFYYYGGEYDSDDHGQAEESVIRKVFEGMSSENEQQGDSTYSHQKYPADSDGAVAAGTVTTYAGDVQNNGYASQRYDANQSGYNSGGTRGTYNSGTSQNGYNAGTHEDASAFYNVDQANKYYSSNGQNAATAASPSNANTNATDSTSGARVRYREVATGAVVDPGSPNPQQITKKSDYYGYNTGQVRYRNVGTGEISSDVNNQAPRVRFREVGSDTIHYSMSEQTSNEGGVEHGPRNVRVKRQTIGMADAGRKMDAIHEQMINAHRKMAAEVADLADHAKKMTDTSSEIENEIELLFAKKNKVKKGTGVSKPMKIKKGEEDDCDKTKSEMDDDEDPTSIINIEDVSFVTEDNNPDIVDAELVTGVPDATMEVLAQQVEDDDDDAMVDEADAQMPMYGLPVAFTTTEQVPETTTMGVSDEPTNVPELTTEPISSTTPAQEQESTTVHIPSESPENPEKPENPEIQENSPPQSSVVDLLKKIAQLKVQLGINFLKSTSQAFTSYLDKVQKNMEDAIEQGRVAQYKRSDFWNFRRSKREAKKTSHLKKKKSKSG